MSNDVLNTYVQNLKAERDRAWGEQRAVIDAAVAAKRELSSEERATVDRTDAAIDKADADIKGWLDRATREREHGEARSQWDSVLRPDQRETVSRKEDTVEKDLRAFLAGESRSMSFDIVSAAREAHLVRGGADRGEYRDLVTSSAAAGGTLVPTTFARTLYAAMETINGVRASNPYVITTTTGEPFSLPKVSSRGTAAAVGEGTAAAEADAAFTVVTLNSWKFAQLIQVSKEMIRDSAIDIVSFVAEDAGHALGRVTNTAYTTGSGTNTPTGFVTASVLGGTGKVSQTAATGVPSYNDIVDLIYSVGDEYYAGEQAVFQTKFANYAAIRKLTDSQSRPLWQPSLIAGQPSTLFGYRLISNPALAAWSTAATQRTMAFGDFNLGVVIRDVGTVEFERSDHFAFSSGLASFLATLSTDSNMRDRTAVKVMQAPTT